MKSKDPQTKRYTKYEIARLIGSRALEIANGAPFFVELSQKDLEAIKYNPIRIAEIEFKEGVLPVEIKKE
jgi:DNA-directed RNA polymerase subunit K/omega